MLKELIKSNSGETYERSETIILLDVGQDEREEEDIEQEIQETYGTEWCTCSHDCCGHWRTYISNVFFSYSRVIVYLVHVQNV